MLRLRANYELRLTFLMLLRVRFSAAVAGDVGVIAAKDQRYLFQLQLCAAVAGGL